MIACCDDNTRALLAFITLVAIAIIGYKGNKWSKSRKHDDKKERHGFSESIMENVLRKQNHRCAKCKSFKCSRFPSHGWR